MRKIDVVVALAMAALATVREETRPPFRMWFLGESDREEHDRVEAWC